MKRVFLACGIIAMASCTNAVKPSDAVSSDNICDENEQSEDHYAIWKSDSIAEVSFSTFDLAAMEVRGHVKSVTLMNGDDTESARVMKFDKDGNLISMQDAYGRYQYTYIEEEGEKVLSVYALGAGSLCYKVDTINNRLKRLYGGSEGYGFDMKYVYDKNGTLKKIECEDSDPEDNTSKSVSEVKVLKSDEHGNWIERKRGDMAEKRIIKYYPNVLCDEESDDSSDDAVNPFSDKVSFAGSIGGDSNCTMEMENGEGTYTVGVGTRELHVTKYDQLTGSLTIDAYMKSNGNHLGEFRGTFKNGVYEGTFMNHQGGKVPFNLRMK